jgi:O-antigen/teichoic acid export membrane protein
MNNTATRISKNASALFAGMACNTGLMLVFVVYVARTAGVERFGQYALARHFFELFLGISTTAVAILISRRIAQDRSSLNRCLTAAMLIAGLLAVASVALLWGLCYLIGYSADTRWVVMSASVALMPAVVAAILEAAFVAIEKAQYVMWATAFSSVIFVAFGITAVAQGHHIAVIFAGLFIARSLMAVFYLVQLRRSVDSLRWSPDKSYLVGLVKELRVFALENWCSTLSNHLDLILLSVFHNEFAVGVYGAASRVMRLGAMVANSYTRAIFPYLARLGRDAPDMLRRVTESSLKYMLMLVLPLVTMVCVLADRVIDLLYTDSYADATLVLRILVWVVALKFINPFLSHTLFAQDEQHKSLRVAAIRLATYSVLALCLIPGYGAVGAAWTSLGATTIAFCFYYAWVFRSDDSESDESQAGGRGLILLGTLSRILLASLVSGALLVVADESHMLAFVVASGAAYAGLLFALRVVSWHELRDLYKLRMRRHAD